MIKYLAFLKKRKRRKTKELNIQLYKLFIKAND